MAHGNAKYEAEMSDRKRELFADLHGNVLEIGSGPEPNLRYYPRDIHWIGIEPNTYIYPYLQQELTFRSSIMRVDNIGDKKSKET